MAETSSDRGTDRDGPKGPTDTEWVALYVPKFREIRGHYQKYADFLKEVLEQGSSKLAPLAIIGSRVKSIASFAEKILRKREKYGRPDGTLPADPLVRMTDLCGGRVIAQTSAHVDAMCEFIKEVFDVDLANSEDASQRLRPTEFGYRSVHYVVTVNPEKLRDAGITTEVPPEILELKAEIQVRTLLEHAWADIGHEMTYKTELKVPDRIRRQFAALAAVLEGVDRQLGSLLHGLEEFKSNFGAYHKPEEVEAEIDRLRIVLSVGSDNPAGPGNPDMAVKIAQLALSIGRHEIALEILEPYTAQGHQGVERVRGVALTELYWDHPRSEEFLEGRRSLEASCDDQRRDHRCKDAETLCVLAESWLREDDSEAGKRFHEAVGVDATEPVTLSRYLEFEIAHSRNDAVVHMAEPMIQSAADRCRKQIEARVNVPWAWASLAVLNLLLEKPFEALEAIAQLVRLCEPGGKGGGGMCAAGRALLRTGDALKRIRCIREKLLPGFDWCQRAVLVGLAARVQDPEATEALRKLVSWGKEGPHVPKDKSIVVLAGGCVPEVQPALDVFKPVLLRACEGVSFTLFCGGTTAGISGLAGDLAAQSGDRIRAYGYLPKLLPRGVQEDLDRKRFVRSFSSSGDDFTPLEPLQGWTDVVAAGADPRRVKLLHFGGGQISRAECMTALALGARVGVVQDAVLPKDRQFDEPGWQDCPNLVRLPMDAMTLRAFFLVDEIPCKKEFAKAAELAHEEYRRTTVPEEPSLRPWEKLPEDLRVSNFHQIAYAEDILKSAGLGLRPITDPGKPLLKMDEVLGAEGIARLAEMEHGRWNVERLLLGWRRAEAKDVVKRLSPYLTPWDSLSRKIQQYDLEAVCSFPAKFREAGLEVYRLAPDPAE
jgi:ppGpp synthetase/RelA/SpoT-type nucleotidyltranferase